MRQRHATLAFTDESGYLLAPLTRPSLARRGHTPAMIQANQSRDKVSVAAALTVSPERGHVSLFYQPYPDLYVDTEIYACFLRWLLGHLSGPVVLLQDQGPIHKGPPLRQLCADHPRLELVPLPIYAPELNPCENIWGYSKSHPLANYPPADVPELLMTLCYCLEDVRHDQTLLKGFFADTPLPWNGLTLFS